MAIEHDVAELQAEVHQLRADNDSLHATNAAQAQELDSLRIEAVMLRAKSEREIRRSEAMYTILQQVSNGLISGITRMDAMDRDTRRRQQEDRLGVGHDTDAPPASLTGRTPSAAPATMQGPAVEPAQPRGRAVITRKAGEPQDRPAQRVGDRHLDLVTRAWWELGVSGWRPDGTYEPTEADGTINQTLADRDSRMPRVDFGENDADRQLRGMAEDILRRPA